MTKLLSAFFLALLICDWSLASETKAHLVRVHRSTVRFPVGLQIDSERVNGICIDQSCSIVATICPEQRVVGRGNFGIVGSRTLKVLSLTNAPDTTKMPEGVPVGIAVQLSFIYTKSPILHKAGISFSYSPQVGQKVWIAGFNGDWLIKQQARIIGIDNALSMGREELRNTIMISDLSVPVVGGSAVLDVGGKLLGMVIYSGRVSDAYTSANVAIALPVALIGRTFARLDPVIAPNVFRDLPPLTVAQEEGLTSSRGRNVQDIPFVPIPTLSALPSDIPDAVVRLQAKASAASKAMVNLIAKQCLTIGNTGTFCHELSVVDGEQRFREIKSGNRLGKPTETFPIQSHAVWITTDWAETLGAIAEQSWVFEGTNDKHYVFTYRAGVGDDRCSYREYSTLRSMLSLFGEHPAWEGKVPCFVQILTDEDFNITAIFTERTPPSPCNAQIVQTAFYYEWTQLAGLASPLLLPARETVIAEMRGENKLLHSEAVWSDYKQFRVSTTFSSQLPPQ